METKTSHQLSSSLESVVLKVNDSRKISHPIIRKSIRRMNAIKKLVHDGDVNISYYGNCDGSPLRGW